MQRIGACLFIVLLALGLGCRGGYERLLDAGVPEIDGDAGRLGDDGGAGDPGDDADAGDPGDYEDAGFPPDDGGDESGDSVDLDGLDGDGLDGDGLDGDDLDGDGLDGDGDQDTPLAAGWTWSAGNSAGFAPPNYGQQGVPDPANHPGGRNHSGFGKDSQGGFLLIGGWVPGNNRRNDLWRFHDGQWVWLSGSQEMNQPAVYGPRGVAGPNVVPGAVEGHASCTDAAGNLWTLGGWGFVGEPDVTGDTGDLWRYSPQGWAWMAGPQVLNVAGVYGDQGTPDPANHPGTRQYAGMFCAFGGVWLFGGFGRDAYGVRGRLADLWFFNGTDWTWYGGSDAVSTAPGVYGSQGEFAPDYWPGARTYPVFAQAPGSSLIHMFGGKAIDESGYASQSNELWAFNGSQWAWIGGSKTAEQPGVYGTPGVAAAGNSPGSRYQTVMIADAQDNLWLFGGSGYDESGTFGTLNDLWKFDGSQWAWMTGPKLADQPGLYPPSWNLGGDPYTPGARFSPGLWIDEQGLLWLYGGYGYDSEGTQLDLNDLWVFNPGG